MSTSVFTSVSELRKLSNAEIDKVMAVLPPIEALNSSQRRGIIGGFPVRDQGVVKTGIRDLIKTGLTLAQAAGHL